MPPENIQCHCAKHAYADPTRLIQLRFYHVRRVSPGGQGRVRHSSLSQKARPGRGVAARSVNNSQQGGRSSRYDQGTVIKPGCFPRPLVISFQRSTRLASMPPLWIDWTAVAGNAITVTMRVSQPGDWIRVVTRSCQKSEVLIGSGVDGEGLDDAPGLKKDFNPKSKACQNAGKK